MEERKNNIILDKSFDFSVKIIWLYTELRKDKEFVISKQLLRSATSIGANLVEWNSAESKKDFLHKLWISLKEAKETLYRLTLLVKSKLVDLNYEDYIKDTNEIIAILTKIIITTRNNLQKEK